ncbi:hypothetical protein [Roseococcus sp.]|uniref:hypothetical protein n=1 Tax=Roseococcus sp. TaxID=2109646 RepID=UPI003BA9CDD0
MDMKIVGPWAVRMLLLALGGWLTRAGVGDAGLWGNVADTLAGPLVVAGTAIWSWRATRVQVETPAEPEAQVRAAVTAVANAVPSADEIAAKVTEQMRLNVPGARR